MPASLIFCWIIELGWTLHSRSTKRVFITGVSPIVMADMSSGYNVAKNIYLEPEFNALCGFTEGEVNTVLLQVAQHCGLDTAQSAEAMDIMRTFYNGYCFNVDQIERLYNPTLVIYFLETFQKRCHAPDEMLDSNLAMDRTRISYISQLGGSEQLVETARREQPPLSVPTLAYRFGVAEMRQYKLLDILLEFKYLKLGDVGLDGAALQAKPMDELRQLDTGKAQIAEARAQLQTYRATLTARDGARLRLRTFAVVVLGFERLVWTEITA